MTLFSGLSIMITMIKKKKISRRHTQFKYLLIIQLILVLPCVFSCSRTDKFKYPKIKKEPVKDNYYGHNLEDSYRNLENLKDSTVRNWFKDQNTFADSTLRTINNREHLVRIQQEYNKKKNTTISRKVRLDNGTYFFLKQGFEEDISKLYFRSSFSSSDSLIFDPSNYKPNSSYKYVINYISPDWDGNQIVVSLSKKGEEISELLLIDLKTKKRIYTLTANAAPQVLFGISWLPDNSGFIYQDIPNFTKNDPSYFHNTTSVLYTIGTKNKSYKFKKLISKSTHSSLRIKSEDFPVVSYKDRTSNYIFAGVYGATPYSDTYYASIKNLDSKDIPWKLLFKKKEKIKKHVFKDNHIIYLTAKNASNFEICKTSIFNPDFSNPEIIVRQKDDKVITDFEFTKQGLFYTTLKNGVSAKLFHLSKGKEKEIKLPKDFGTIIINSNAQNSDYLRIQAAGWVSPKNTYLYDHSNNRFIPDDLSSNSLSKYFSDIEVKEVEVKSHDGSLVPLSIIYNPNLKLNGKNSTLVWGYGSYGISFKPTFSTSLLTWVRAGGVLAMAHVRGGGEKGNDWYEGGLKTTKPNTWKDAISCTEYLIEKGYTSKDKTAIFGSSAGGIMMGRAITERPDLYKVAIGDVPSMNMIRSETTSNGLNSVKEFGTVKDSIEFKGLLEMDSYHQIKNDVDYPATLIASGYNDARVATWSPGKFIARLQQANSSNNPILFLVDFDAGHSVHDSKLKTYEKFANYFAFALWQTGHPDYQPKN